MKKKLFIFIISLICIYVFNFFIPRLMPGDPFVHSSSEPGMEMEELSKEELQRLKAYYGLDKPILEQFKNTLLANLKGDFGYSILYKRPVSEILIERLPWTMYILLTTLTLSLIIGVLLALISVNFQKACIIIHKIMSVLTEIPPFVIGILFLFLIAAKVSWIPLSNNVTPFKTFNTAGEWIYDVFIHSLMPMGTLIIVNSSRFYFTAFTSFRVIKDKKYMLYAKSKGLSRFRIMTKYMLRNGALPIIARFFLSVGNAIGATMVIETVFAYPGLGKILRDSVNQRDFILIQGVFLLSTFIVLISSLISDVINGFIAKRSL